MNQRGGTLCKGSPWKLAWGCPGSLWGENWSSNFSRNQLLNSFGVGSSALCKSPQADPVCFKSFRQPLIQQLST